MIALTRIKVDTHPVVYLPHGQHSEVYLQTKLQLLAEEAALPQLGVDVRLPLGEELRPPPLVKMVQQLVLERESNRH